MFENRTIPMPLFGIVSSNAFVLNPMKAIFKVRIHKVPHPKERFEN